MYLRIHLAYTMAQKAHEGQKRRGGEAYIKHPWRVMHIVSRVSDEEDLKIAALLHDTVEDSDMTWSVINSLFGKKVADIVEYLSDDEEIARLPRSERKARQAKKYASAPVDVQLIKMADQIDNMTSILNDFHVLPEKFRSEYPAAAFDVVNACRPGSEILFTEASDIYRQITALQAGVTPPSI